MAMKKRAAKSRRSKARAPGRKKSSAKKPTRKKASSAKKPARKKAARNPARKGPVKRARVKRPVRRRTRPVDEREVEDRRADFEVPERLEGRGLGPESAGQSGDTLGLSRSEIADSESVEELIEEGQAFEAGVISGVENAPDADQGGVRTREVPEDDVPQEYLDEQ
jgi:hypothetical protein